MKLERSADDKWIAGVAGGLAKSFGVDATIVRIAFATVGVFAFGTGIMLYIALWVILPRPTGGTIAQDGIHRAQEWNADRRDRKNGGSDFTV